MFPNGTSLQLAKVMSPHPHTVAPSNYSFWWLRCPSRHRAVNLFIQGYEKSWIEAEEHYFEDKLIEDLAVSSYKLVILVYLKALLNLIFCIFWQKPGERESLDEEEGIKLIDPLHQIIQLFSRTALTEKWCLPYTLHTKCTLINCCEQTKILLYFTKNGLSKRCWPKWISFLTVSPSVWLQ